VKAAIYTRVSTDEQAREGYSLGEQERQCMELIGREHWQHVGTYSDPGISGAERERPGLTALLARLDEIDVIVVAAADRLGRDLIHLAELRQTLRGAGVELRALTASIVDDGSSGAWLATTMADVFGDYERRRIKERTREGVRARVRAGLPQGQAPYGYKREGGGLVVVKSEVPIVRRVFREYVAGKPLLQIARALNRKGVPTKRGGKWAASTVRGMIRCDLYVARPPWQHKPIIDEATWDRAQALIGTPIGRARSEPRRKYIFIGGLLRCGECGEAMTPHGDKYRCRGRQAFGTDHCSQGPVSRELIDSAAVEHFRDALHDLDSTVALAGQRVREELEETRALLSQAERAAVQATTRLERVKRDYQDDKIDADDWREQRTQLTTEREAAEAEVKRLQAAAERRPMIKPLADLRAAIAAEVAGAPDVDAIRAALRATYEKFVLHRGPLPEGLTAADAGALSAEDFYLTMDVRDDAWVYLGPDEEPHLRSHTLNSTLVQLKPVFSEIS
jgi:site-specific DNA recombinase